MRHQHTQELLLRIEGIRLGRGSGHPSPLEPFPGWLWAPKTHPESHGHHSQRAARPLGPGLGLGSRFWAPKWDNPAPLGFQREHSQPSSLPRVRRDALPDPGLHPAPHPLLLTLPKDGAASLGAHVWEKLLWVLFCGNPGCCSTGFLLFPCPFVFNPISLSLADPEGRFPTLRIPKQG